jgi:hypothetical protein
MSSPKTLAEKVWDDHLVAKGEDGSPKLDTGVAKFLEPKKAEFLALMKAEYPRYAKLIKQANLRID